MKLYNYFRSSASFRVRIALHHKQLPFEYIPVHLVKNGGEQNSAEFRKINPMGHVPALEHNGSLIAESVAILEYLEAIQPARPLFPSSPLERAHVLQVCELINSGIQPLQNLKVIKELEQNFGLVKADTDRFVRHWIQDGLRNLEHLLADRAGTFCFGGEFTAADCFLVPQCFASKRFGIQIEDYPNISRINQNALKLEAVQKAHPEQQIDYSA